MIHYCKIAIQIKYEYDTENKKCFQHFIVVDKKYKKYALQNKYSISEKFENAIKMNALSLIDSNFIFVNRVDKDDEIILEFNHNGSQEQKVSEFFALVGEIPYSDGCEECKFFNECDYSCDKKCKTIDKKLKTCKFFSQKTKAEL